MIAAHMPWTAHRLLLGLSCTCINQSDHVYHYLQHGHGRSTFNCFPSRILSIHVVILLSTNRYYRQWTEEEETALQRGVERHGVGSWESIRKDPELGILRCVVWVTSAGVVWVHSFHRLLC